MRMSALIVAVILLPATRGQDGPSKDEADPSGKKVKELRTERIAALKKVVQASYELAESGRYEITRVADARLRLLKAELEVTVKESDRIALYKQAVVSLEQYEQVAKAKRDAARGPVVDIYAIEAMRLEVEIQLEQAKLKAAK